MPTNPDSPIGLAGDAMLIALDTLRAGGSNESAMSAATAVYEDVQAGLADACATAAVRIVRLHPGQTADVAREVGEYAVTASFSVLGEQLQGAVMVGGQLLAELAAVTNTEPGAIIARVRNQLGN